MQFRRRTRPRHAAPRRRYRVAAVSLACAVAASGTGVLIHEFGHSAAPAPVRPAAVLDLDRGQGNAVSRDYARTAPSPSTSDSSSPSAAPSPAPPARVAGLDQAQTANAVIVVQVGSQRGLARHALVVAIATALQESDLRNVASSAVPESLRYPHQGIEVDHDSVGLFQQRPSQGWGSVAELMDPARSAALFFSRLVQVPGWQSMSVTAAAQAVQKSAFPDAYAQHQSQAEQIVAALA